MRYCNIFYVSFKILYFSSWFECHMFLASFWCIKISYNTLNATNLNIYSINLLEYISQIRELRCEIELFSYTNTPSISDGDNSRQGSEIHSLLRWTGLWGDWKRSDDENCKHLNISNQIFLEKFCKVIKLWMGSR